MEDIKEVSLLLMGNTVKIENPKKVENIFDLKGSLINRECKINKHTKNTSTLKDVNLIKVCVEKLVSIYTILLFYSENLTFNIFIVSQISEGRPQNNYGDDRQGYRLSFKK
jgi:hypothetical protein